MLNTSIFYSYQSILLRPPNFHWIFLNVMLFGVMQYFTQFITVLSITVY